jgi:hypothetical protein
VTYHAQTEAEPTRTTHFATVKFEGSDPVEVYLTPEEFCWSMQVGDRSQVVSSLGNGKRKITYTFVQSTAQMILWHAIQKGAI